MQTGKRKRAKEKCANSYLGAANDDQEEGTEINLSIEFLHNSSNQILVIRKLACFSIKCPLLPSRNDFSNYSAAFHYQVISILRLIYFGDDSTNSKKQSVHFPNNTQKDLNYLCSTSKALNFTSYQQSFTKYPLTQ